MPCAPLCERSSAGYKIDGITVRASRSNALAVTYPRRSAADGRTYAYFLPTDPTVSAELEAAILAAYRQHEEGRS